MLVNNALGKDFHRPAYRDDNGIVLLEKMHPAASAELRSLLTGLAFRQ
jgi:hypothetical protein